MSEKWALEWVGWAVPPDNVPVLAELNGELLDLWYRRKGEWVGCYHGMRLRETDKITRWCHLPKKADGGSYEFNNIESEQVRVLVTENKITR